MAQAPEAWANELLQYLEREEARLEELGKELGRLRQALASGRPEPLSEAIGSFLRQLELGRTLQKQRESLQTRLPRTPEGRVDWVAVEATLASATAEAVRRQRQRLKELVEQVQRQLRQVAVLAWFGQELYERILKAILGERESSGQYSCQGVTPPSAGRHFLQILG